MAGLVQGKSSGPLEQCKGGEPRPVGWGRGCVRNDNRRLQYIMHHAQYKVLTACGALFES